MCDDSTRLLASHLSKHTTRPLASCLDHQNTSGFILTVTMNERAREGPGGGAGSETVKIGSVHGYAMIPCGFGHLIYQFTPQEVHRDIQLVRIRRPYVPVSAINAPQIRPFQSVNNIVHSLSLGAYSGINHVLFTSGDLWQPYPTSVSLIVANTTTRMCAHPCVRPSYPHSEIGVNMIRVRCEYNGFCSNFCLCLISMTQ